jgi:hypothetical protein
MCSNDMNKLIILAIKKELMISVFKLPRKLFRLAD